MSYSIPFDIEPMNYEQAKASLKEQLRLGICPMIETVEEMLEIAGNPDLCFSSIQIAGTNGKSSTARYTAALLKQAGYITALYTSPHLVEYTERMEINQEHISEDLFATAISAAYIAGVKVNEKRAQNSLEPYSITEFDILTVAACIAFALSGVQVAILEVGMGGRWDATSAVKSIVASAITGVSLDHTHVLGDTLAEIAGEKAAVIKQGRETILGVGCTKSSEVMDVLAARCLECGVRPTIVVERVLDLGAHAEYIEHFKAVHPIYSEYLITRKPHAIGDTILLDIETPEGFYTEIGALKPVYQAQNIALAIVIVETVLRKFIADDIDIAQAIVTCPTPGRFDVRRAKPLMLVDACHNPESVEQMISSLHEFDKETCKPALLCAVLEDKDYEQMAKQLADEFEDIYVVQTDSPRALVAEKLAEVFENAGNKPEGVFTSVAEAVDALADKDVIACGSITLAGEITALLKGEGRMRGML